MNPNSVYPRSLQYNRVVAINYYLCDNMDGTISYKITSPNPVIGKILGNPTEVEKEVKRVTNKIKTRYLDINNNVFKFKTKNENIDKGDTEKTWAHEKLVGKMSGETKITRILKETKSRRVYKINTDVRFELICPCGNTFDRDVSTVTLKHKNKKTIYCDPCLRRAIASRRREGAIKKLDEKIGTVYKNKKILEVVNYSPAKVKTCCVVCGEIKVWPYNRVNNVCAGCFRTRKAEQVKEKKRRAENLHKAGEPMQEVARRLDRTLQTVKRYLKDDE